MVSDVYMYIHVHIHTRTYLHILTIKNLFLILELNRFFHDIQGSFATASCTRCKYQVKADDIREDIFSQRIPLCPKCRVNTLPPISETNLNENYKGNYKY